MFGVIIAGGPKVGKIAVIVGPAGRRSSWAVGRPTGRAAFNNSISTLFVFPSNKVSLLKCCNLDWLTKRDSFSWNLILGLSHCLNCMCKLQKN